MIGIGACGRCVIAIAVDVLRHIGRGGAGEGSGLGIVAEFRGKLVDAGKAAERREVHCDAWEGFP